MNEAGDGRGPAGSPLRGSTVGLPACASCSHFHKVTESLGDYTSALTITYDTACPECQCVASGTDYTRGITDAADLAVFTHIGIDLNRQPSEPTAARAIYDDTDNYCGSLSFPRAIDGAQRRDLAAGPRVRGDTVGSGDVGSERVQRRPRLPELIMGRVRWNGLCADGRAGDARAADDRRQPGGVAALVGYACGWLSRLVTR